MGPFPDNEAPTKPERSNYPYSRVVAVLDSFQGEPERQNDIADFADIYRDADARTRAELIAQVRAFVYLRPPPR